MKYFVPASILAMATGAHSLATFTNSAFSITQGQPFTLTWSGASGPVTIKVANGPSTDAASLCALHQQALVHVRSAIELFAQGSDSSYPGEEQQWLVAKTWETALELYQ